MANALDQVGNIAQQIFGIGMYALTAIAGIAIVGFIAWFIMKRKRYNVPVEIKIPRSDGKIIDAEWAKGRYETKKGESAFIIKRKKMKKVAIPPPSIEYLQGKNKILTVIQKGIEDYHPVQPDSFQEIYVSNPTSGKSILTHILNLKTKDYKIGAWGNYYERSRKARFSLENLWGKYGNLISVMLVVFVMFIATAILWSQLEGVVTGLHEVATRLGK